MLAGIHRAYGDQGVKVVAVNIDSAYYSLDEWIAYWKGNGAGDVVWAQDPQGDAARLYGVLALGTKVLVDQEGRIVFRGTGIAAAGEVHNQVRALLQ